MNEKQLGVSIKESPDEVKGITIKLTTERIILLNGWLNHYRNELGDTKHIGITTGIENTLKHMNIYYNVTYDKKEREVLISEETLSYLIEKMKRNSIEALWNLGLASGICWTLELLGLLESNYSGVNQINSKIHLT